MAALIVEEKTIGTLAHIVLSAARWTTLRATAHKEYRVTERGHFKVTGDGREHM